MFFNRPRVLTEFATFLMLIIVECKVFDMLCILYIGLYVHSYSYYYSHTCKNLRNLNICMYECSIKEDYHERLS